MEYRGEVQSSGWGILRGDTFGILEAIGKVDENVGCCEVLFLGNTLAESHQGGFENHAAAFKSR